MTNADIDYIEQQLEATTLSWPQMVKRYGADWTRWPSSTKWFQALTRLEAGRTVEPPPTQGNVWFDDGFETENPGFTAHWNGLQAAPGRVTLVQRAGSGGAKAARFEVRVGDNNIAGSGSGERAETFKSGTALGAVWGREGTDSYIALRVFFEAPFPYVPNQLWNAFAQWHASAGGTQACSLTIYNGQIRCVTNGGANLTDKPFNQGVLGQLVTGKWLDFTVRQHWSSDPAKGFFEVVRRDEGGSWQTPVRVNGANLYKPDTGLPYPKIGIYRAPGASGSAAVVYGRYRIADTLDLAAAALP